MDEIVELEIRFKELKTTYFISPEELTLIESVLPELVVMMIQNIDWDDDLKHYRKTSCTLHFMPAYRPPDKLRMIYRFQTS